MSAREDRKEIPNIIIMEIKSLSKYYLLLHIFLFSFENQGISFTDTSKVKREKKMEFNLSYNQFDKGFIGGTFSFYHFAPYSYLGYNDHSLSFGYSPWRESYIMEMNHRYSFVFIFSFGLGGGRCQDFNNDGVWYLKPEIGFNFNYFKIYCAYSFTTNPEYLRFNKGFNFIMDIPVFSTTSNESRKKVKFGAFRKW
jgi:hypothetical protein